jgi:hypothetical protein
MKEIILDKLVDLIQAIESEEEEILLKIATSPPACVSSLPACPACFTLARPTMV